LPDYGHELEFGVFVTPAAGNADAVVALATAADRAGLDLVSFQDHPYQPRFLDTWTLLSYVAARTSRVRLAANVLNLPLRPPAVVARAVASLDILSSGRAELGLGAGAFWDGVEAMGGRRLGPGAAVKALEEGIDVIRLLWDSDEPGPASYDGRYYSLAGATRGPTPLHDLSIWLGAYKPKMLALTGRPSLPYLQAGDLAAGNAAIDEAATSAGRDPAEIRRLLNVPGAEARPEELARMAIEDGVASFIVMADDSSAIDNFAAEVAPAVRAQVEAERAHGTEPQPAPERITIKTGAGESEYERLGIAPTPDDGARVGSTPVWDESTRPHRARSGPDVAYSDTGRLVGKHLIDVHDHLRTELAELRNVLEQVRDGAMKAGEARAALNRMALRQNDWTLGAFCSRYCAMVTGHHGLEDDAVFPHLARSDTTLAPVIDRLVEEHLTIHDAIHGIDQALIEHISTPGNYAPLQETIDFLTDALLSHLSYEEQELVEPLARLGFYPGQV
jgi:alkanesulfonate monooxygenase SsuD/methylene tetrahydromethanopterin reductase-like flavin-dependent oxidoreductase (luciferase family)